MLSFFQVPLLLAYSHAGIRVTTFSSFAHRMCLGIRYCRRFAGLTPGFAEFSILRTSEGELTYLILATGCSCTKQNKTKGSSSTRRIRSLLLLSPTAVTLFNVFCLSSGITIKVWRDPQVRRADRGRPGGLQASGVRVHPAQRRAEGGSVGGYRPHHQRPGLWFLFFPENVTHT